MTNTQKTDAVRAAYQRLLDERPGWATLAEVLKDPEAERMLAHIDRGLAKLRAEDARLKAELAGTSDPAAHFHEAIEHTRRIEAEFRQELARMGHPHQTSPAVRRQIEETAPGLHRADAWTPRPRAL